MLPRSKASSVAVTVFLFSMVGACVEGSSRTSQPDTSDTPDTTAPTISATANVGTDAVVLSASASDNIAVTQVEFVVDRGATKATVSASPSESVFSTSIPIKAFGAGSHSVVARAVDAAGNATVTEPVSFDVGPGAPPVSPLKVTASSTQDGGNVTFTVDIESDAQISLTNFFIDGEFAGGRADDQRHFSFSRLLSPGTHRLVVDVSDVNGKTADAEVVVEI